MTLTVADQLMDSVKAIPEENETKTQYLDYRNTNPVDIIKDIVLNQLGLDAAFVDEAQFDSERDRWFYDHYFDRVITKPKDANRYLNELQTEMLAFLYDSGEKVSFRAFAPPLPGQTVDELSDTTSILKDSIECSSGYSKHFYNRIEIFYNYDESGSEGEEHYESVAIHLDAPSRTNWGEKTLTIYSKWIRTHTFEQPTNVTGVILYHVSGYNGLGNGTLAFIQSANTLTWKAPGGTTGEAVKISKDGKYQLFDGDDKTKSVRVVVSTASLPTSNKSDQIGITFLQGDFYVKTLASRLLARFKSPVPTLKFTLGLREYAFNGKLRQVTDPVDITVDEAFEKDNEGFVKKRCMITSLRPDFSSCRIAVEAFPTRMDRRYLYIAPPGWPDYPSATEAEREYGFVGDADNKVNSGVEDGYYIW